MYILAPFGFSLCLINLEPKVDGGIMIPVPKAASSPAASSRTPAATDATVTPPTVSVADPAAAATESSAAEPGYNFVGAPTPDPAFNLSQELGAVIDESLAADAKRSRANTSGEKFGKSYNPAEDEANQLSAEKEKTQDMQ